MKWTKLCKGSHGVISRNIMYTETTGRFVIYKRSRNHSYDLYDNDQHVRGFSRLAGAKWWANELAEGRKPTAVRN